MTGNKRKRTTAGKRRKQNLVLIILIFWIVLVLLLLLGMGIYVGINGIPDKSSLAESRRQETAGEAGTAGNDAAENHAAENSLSGNRASGEDTQQTGAKQGNSAEETTETVPEDNGSEEDDSSRSGDGTEAGNLYYETYQEEEQVESLQAVYNSRSPLYAEENKVTEETTGAITRYMLDGEIIEISAGYDSENYRFYYDGGELYYAALGWTNSVVGTSDENELYYYDGQLIRWVDSDGEIHELEDSEGYLFWEADQEWASELYVKASAGNLTGEETPPVALSETLAFENPETAGMVFPDSDSRYLTDTEVSTLDSNQIQYAIDEIYARRGYNLGENEYGEYFRQFNWYQPVDGSANEIVELFNEYEAYNVNLLVSYQ